MAAAPNPDGRQRMGYIDRQDRFVIPPKFINAYKFHEGLARVQVSERAYGFINKSGQFVIPPTLSLAYDFDHGATFAVTDPDCADLSGGGSCGPPNYQSVFPDRPEPINHCRFMYIGRDGQPITEQRFDEVTQFEEDGRIR